MYSFEHSEWIIVGKRPAFSFSLRAKEPNIMIKIMEEPKCLPWKSQPKSQTEPMQLYF